jgi:hypothetical protein
MTIFICRCIFAFLCMIYIVFGGYFAGLAHDYMTTGYGLIPMVAMPAAILMLIFSIWCYRLAFVSYPDECDTDQEEPAILTWPELATHMSNLNNSKE